MTLTTAPAAGWYHDPADPGAWRWWDGETWTEHVRPMAEGQLATAPIAAEPVASVPVASVPVASVPVAPVQTAPVQTGPVQTGPAQTAPEAAPAPVQTGPVQYVPAQPAPAPAPAPVVDFQPVPTHAPVFEEAAPAAPAASPAPVQVSPSTIPQPGQVASGPAVSGGPVSMTPQTPVSDQLYWHSAAAEIIEVPRQQQRDTQMRTGSASTAPAYVRDWNDLGSPNTAGVWLLAVWPLLSTLAGFLVLLAMATAGVPGIVPRLASTFVIFGLAWIFAALDARALAHRGYHPPRLAWMLLLPPLAYLIARGKAVRRESKSAWPPELVFILTYLLVGGLAFLGSAYIVAMGLVPLPAS